MTPQTFVTLLLAGGGVAVVYLALWWLLKGVVWLMRRIVTHWRTSGTVAVPVVWWYWIGWLWLVVPAAVVALLLTVWRLVDAVAYDRWCGRFLPAWWLRWMIDTSKLPGWLVACGLTVKNDQIPVEVTVNLVGRRNVRSTRANPNKVELHRYLDSPLTVRGSA